MCGVHSDLNRIMNSSHYLSNKNRVKIIRHDLNYAIEDKLFNEIKDCNYIINLAGMSHIEDSITSSKNFIMNNINIMINILDLVKKIQCEKFIHFSTDEIYGPIINNVLHKEWSTIIPANPYAGSKAAQEAIAISYWKSFKIPLIITNTMTIFGEKQGSEKYFMKIIKSILNQEKINIHSNNGIPGSRSYLHARNAADAVLFILNNVDPIFSPDSLVPERFNIVDNNNINNLEIAKLIAEIMNKELNYEITDSQIDRPGTDINYGLDDSKLKSLRYNFPVTFKNSLVKSINWTVENDERLK